MLDKYTTEHMKAADESISKVLDWFTRSEEMPSVNTRLEEMKTPPEPIVESKPKAVITVHAKPDTEFSHIETDVFTKKSKVLPYINHEIQGQEEQEIQLQKVQTQIKENIFDKSVTPEPIFLEHINKAGTKNDFEITSTVTENIVQCSNDNQQHVELEQNEESEQGLSVLKPFSEKGRVGAKKSAISGQSENTQSTSEDVDFLLIASNKNSAQETKTTPESTSLNIEEPKTLPTIGTKDTTKEKPTTIKLFSPKHKTSYQENSFANAVFGKLTKKDNTFDMKSFNYRSLLLANKETNRVTTENLCSTFLNNGAVQQNELPDLDQTKAKKEQSNDEINQQKINVNEKGQVTTRYENPFLENEGQGPKEIEHTPVYNAQSASTENIALSKTETNNPPTEQNEQESNTLQWKRNFNVPDLEQTSNKEENKTEVNPHLKGNDVNIIPEKEKPFTIVSIKKRIYETSDDPHLSHTEFTNLRNFWGKGTKSHDDDNAQSVLPNTPDDKHLMITKMATRTEPETLLKTNFLVTRNPIPVRRIITLPPSNFETPEEPTENESTKTQGYSGPTIQDRMQQILLQRQSQTEKKRLNTKYFPKVLPTEPGEMKVKFKKATNASNEDELFPTFSDFQKHSSEVEEEAQERTICQPKLKELNTLNIGLQKLLWEKDESGASPVEKPNKYEVLQPENQAFLLSDNESIDRKTANSQPLLEDINLRNLSSGQNSSKEIRNNEEPHTFVSGFSPVTEENTPEKNGHNVDSLHNRIQSILKPTDISYQDENLPIKQSSPNKVSNNEENLTLFAGRSPIIEENVIPQKKLNNVESLDSMIQGILKPTDMSFQEEKTSPVKSDRDAKYDEGLEIGLDKDKRDFELQDEFQTGLNLPSGITRTSTFKESDDGPIKKSTEVLESDMPYNSDQDASPRNAFSNHSGGDDHLHAETWRSSLSEEEEMPPLALKRSSRTSETYKSLQDVNAIASISSVPTSPEHTSLLSKRMKRLSKSVPAFPENDDADSMSENSFQMDKYGTIASSLTNISNSSGMASRSSVSGSTMSIYSGDFGNIDVKGRIQFSLDYVDKLKEFHIFVVRCSDLAAAEEKKNRSDPYVKSYLLPDKIKMGKRKTSVKKKTLNPVYNEILRYKIEKATLLAQTLNLSVWHNDTFGRNNFLGEVEIDLEKWDWSNKKMDWYNLKPRTLSTNRMDDKGSLKVAFRYIPQGNRGKKTGEVQIWVKEASNLPQIRANRLDPFVKCFILPDTSRKSRQKTRVVKKNRNPTFNHTMVYDGFRTEDLKDACVELSVWDHDKLVNHFLGGLRIGLGTGKSYGMAVDWMDSTQEEVSVWDKMITHPNVWIEDVLPLRMLMLSKMSGN
ncbi:synaptotagmin-like protein 2 isoform X2 [Heptranchias perlo]|uniref:synaptotagmin-like protein 2 isoform X2 n=1 Tax=Heptranchias perlo TaxID=212740 RepID=UPI00355A3C92